MSRYRYNFAGGFYEEVLDHQKASEALNFLAFKIKRVSYVPRTSLHNICQFQRMMTQYVWKCKVIYVDF